MSGLKGCLFLLKFSDGTEACLRLPEEKHVVLWGEPTDVSTFQVPPPYDKKCIVEILAVGDID